MRTSTNSCRHILAWLLLAVGSQTSSCAQPGEGPVSAAPGDQVTVSKSMRQIDSLIGDASCRNDADCRVIGVGAVACGGPEAYRAWSVWQTDGQALKALVDRDAAARRNALERDDRRSTCAILVMPGVACVPVAAQEFGRCSLIAAGKGGQ